MSTTSSRRDYESSTKGACALGGAAFAGVMLTILGAFQALQGIAALATTRSMSAGINYVYEFDLTTWGWIHLVLGLIAVAAGWASSRSRPGRTPWGW